MYCIHTHSQWLRDWFDTFLLYTRGLFEEEEKNDSPSLTLSHRKKYPKLLSVLINPFMESQRNMK